ncbi:hypothetical protein SEA_OLANP_82 [Mycobacterium phage OlanP]|nr:hypothetical protein SEA_OLANP_82 [Mycobacterium phage OlanP]
MDGKTAKMQKQVAKLLRHAEDVVGTPEEAVFMAKAFELIAKYGLDMASIEADKQGLDTSDMPDAIKWSARIDGKYTAQQVLLLHGIVIALHCKAVLTHEVSSGTRMPVLHVFGVPRHIERVQFLWEILRPQMLRLVDSVRPAEGFTPRYTYDYRTGEYRQKKTSGQLKSYRRAWIAGFAQTVSERVKAQEDKVLESADSGALVLYRGDKERAALALREAFPRTRRARGRTRFDSNGYAHGQRDGRSASLARALAS